MGPQPLKRPPVFREDGTIEIHLTRGYVAIIDAEDGHLAAYNWNASVNKRTGLVYAVNGRGNTLHCAVTGLRPGAQDRKVAQVDHEDGDTLNCRRGNLRVVTAQVNCRNRAMRADNTSGFVGVQRHRGRWRAVLDKKHVGYFDTAEAANEARLAAECRKWGIEPRRAAAHGDTA